VDQQYPRLQKVQRMLDVLDRTITSAEQQGDPQVLIITGRGTGEAQVRLRYHSQGGRGVQHVDLAEELGLSGGETVGLLSWAESEGYIRPNYGSSGRGGEVAIGVLKPQMA
jgi:hypothetical protein